MLVYENQSKCLYLLRIMYTNDIARSRRFDDIEFLNS